MIGLSAGLFSSLSLMKTGTRYGLVLLIIGLFAGSCFAAYSFGYKDSTADNLRERQAVVSKAQAEAKEEIAVALKEAKAKWLVWHELGLAEAREAAKMENTYDTLETEVQKVITTDKCNDVGVDALRLFNYAITATNHRQYQE